MTLWWRGKICHAERQYLEKAIMNDLIFNQHLCLFVLQWLRTRCPEHPVLPAKDIYALHVCHCMREEKRSGSFRTKALKFKLKLLSPRIPFTWQVWGYYLHQLLQNIRKGRKKASLGHAWTIDIKLSTEGTLSKNPQAHEISTLRCSCCCLTLCWKVMKMHLTLQTNKKKKIRHPQGYVAQIHIEFWFLQEFTSYYLLFTEVLKTHSNDNHIFNMFL